MRKPLPKSWKTSTDSGLVLHDRYGAWLGGHIEDVEAVLPRTPSRTPRGQLQSEIAALLGASAIANEGNAAVIRHAANVCVVHGDCEKTSITKQPARQTTRRAPS